MSRWVASASCPTAVSRLTISSLIATLRCFPPVQPIAARRIQLANAQGRVPAPLRLLFTLTQGKGRMAPEPGRGFYVVKVNKIVPDNAMARRFRDLAGMLNQRVAAAVETVDLAVSGLTIRMKG